MLGWSGNKNIYISFRNALLTKQSHSHFNPGFTQSISQKQWVIKWQNDVLMRKPDCSSTKSIELAKKFIWVFIRCYGKNLKELFDQLKRIIYCCSFIIVLVKICTLFTTLKLKFVIKDRVRLKCANLFPLYIMNVFLAVRKGLSRYFYCSPSTCQVWRDVWMDTLGWIIVLGGCTTVKRIYTFLDDSGSLAIQAWHPKAAPVSRSWMCPHGGGKVLGVSSPWQWSSNSLDSGLNVLSNSPSRPKATECPSEESFCAFLCG